MNRMLLFQIMSLSLFADACRKYNNDNTCKVIPDYNIKIEKVIFSKKQKLKIKGKK